MITSINNATAIILMAFLLMSLSQVANAQVEDAELSWVYPTEYENGLPIEDGSLIGVILYKDGQPALEQAYPNTTVSIPGTCKSTTWTATALASVGGNTMESAQSESVQQPLEVNCVPKPPALSLQ